MLRENLYSHMMTSIFHTIVSRTVKDGMFLILHIRSVIVIATTLLSCHLCLQINALNILLNPQSELYTYPPSWKFDLALRDDAKVISEHVTCKMLITAGRTKLAQNTIFHLFEHVHRAYGTKRRITLKRPTTLPTTLKGPLLEYTSTTTSGNLVVMIICINDSEHLLNMCMCTG